MGWFWGGDKNNDKDPTKSLNPTLKDFLNSQQPRPYIPAEAPPLPPPPPPPPPAPSTETSTGPRENNAPPSTPVIPAESLFPDGRYAYLWSTYTPLSTQTTSTTTPLERMVSARKDRRDLLHRAALENCAFEHELQQRCFTSGSAASRARARLTMCRDETKAFNRCYSLQGKFLQALGYLSRDDDDGSSTADDEERIQMHADKLYHRMMDYEAEVDAARRAHAPIPPLSSVFNPSRPAPRLEELAVPPHMVAQQQQQRLTLPLPLAELPPQERELAARAALQEAKMTHLYTQEMRAFAEEMEAKRRERQRWVGRVLGEPVAKFVIPDLPVGKEGGG